MADRKTQKLLEGLQQDLTRELHAVLQYSYQAAMALGPRALTLRDYLRQEASAELDHVSFLADQIVNLGGVPKFTAPKIAEMKDLKQMLESDLDMERDAILEYRERAKQAELAGELGLKIRLEGLLAEESDHAHELERMLRGWQ